MSFKIIKSRIRDSKGVGRLWNWMGKETVPFSLHFQQHFARYTFFRWCITYLVQNIPVITGVVLGFFPSCSSAGIHSVAHFTRSNICRQRSSFLDVSLHLLIFCIILIMKPKIMQSESCWKQLSRYTSAAQFSRVPALKSWNEGLGMAVTSTIIPTIIPTVMPGLSTERVPVICYQLELDSRQEKKKK